MVQFLYWLKTFWLLKFSNDNYRERNTNVICFYTRSYPLRGKDMILEERMKQISEIMENTAKSALYKVVAGDGAGRYDLQNYIHH